MSRQSFVASNTCLSRHKYACCDKSFVSTNICVLSGQNCASIVFIATNVSAYFCRLKRRVLSWQTYVTCYVTTMIRVAAPANDSFLAFPLFVYFSQSLSVDVTVSAVWGPVGKRSRLEIERLLVHPPPHPPPPASPTSAPYLCK